MKFTPMTSLALAGGLLSVGFLVAANDAGGSGETNRLMDFEAETTPQWFPVNDGVMGGLSKGKPTVKDGSLHFRGDLSLENNGGFSSIRTAGDYDFSGKDTMVMRVKGDGRTYQLRLATDARYRGSAVSYGADFATQKGQWVVGHLAFEELVPSWRGRKLDGPAFAASKVEEIGILIGDKKAGGFALEVDWIAVQ